MGGYGSGGWYRWSKSDTTDDLLAIDVRWLARTNQLTLGWHRLHWSRGGRPIGDIRYAIIDDTPQPTRLVLDFRTRENGGEWRDIEQVVALEWTPCHYGGVRPWFRCPFAGCGRRVAIIYGGAQFGCRRCYGLAYQSQREDAADRATTQMQQTRRRLGGNGSLIELFPQKPPRMHWKTYRRLARGDRERERLHNIKMMRMFRSLGSKYGRDIERLLEEQ